MRNCVESAVCPVPLLFYRPGATGSEPPAPYLRVSFPVVSASTDAGRRIRHDPAWVIRRPHKKKRPIGSLPDVGAWLRLLPRGPRIDRVQWPGRREQCKGPSGWAQSGNAVPEGQIFLTLSEIPLRFSSCYRLMSPSRSSVSRHSARTSLRFTPPRLTAGPTALGSCVSDCSSPRQRGCSQVHHRKMA